MMALLMFAIKGKQKHSDQQSPIVACSLLLLTVTVVCGKAMVNFIADFCFSTTVLHLCIQIGIAAYIFQIQSLIAVTYSQCRINP